MKGKVVIVDDMFPRLRTGKVFSGRKHAEYLGLMARLEESVAICPKSENYRIADHTSSVEALLVDYPVFSKHRFVYGDPTAELHNALAYVVFPHKAEQFLPYFESARLRFLVTVYPGGGFLMWGPEKSSSLARLKRLVSHPLFKGFIVHHQIIEQYLRKRFPNTSIYEFDGGFSQIDPNTVFNKTYFGRDRTLLNVCFMANRYDPLGLGKGFDVFLESARLVSSRFSNVRFHAVGDWPQDESAGVLPQDPVTFHGYVAAEMLPTFFQDMDIIVSPTRIDVPRPGKFDGFPLVIDAAVCGVAICATDPMSQNRNYRNGQDLWVIEPTAESVKNVITQVINNPSLLERIATNGMTITRRTRNYDKKMDEKASLLSKLALQ